MQDLADFTPSDFRFVCDFIHQQSGLFFDDTKFAVVKTAVRDRMKATGSPNLTGYYELLTGMNFDQATTPNSTIPLSPVNRELNRLIELLTVNETAFFRNKDHFRAIIEEVLPRLIKRNFPQRKLRIWSAGCSTGQEPYSLAISALQALQKEGQSVTGKYGWEVEIFASDISEKVLRMAQAGRYRRDDLKQIEQDIIMRYFLPLSNATVTTAPLDPSQIIAPNRAPLARYSDRVSYEVAPEVKALVRFGYFNLAQTDFPSDFRQRFDLILCENVTIYFPPQITQRVIKHIYDALVEGGFLFIGYSETLWQVSDSFKLINTHDTFYYQKPFPGTITQSQFRSRPQTEPFDQKMPLADKISTDVTPSKKLIPPIPPATPKKPETPKPFAIPTSITDKIRAIDPARINTDELQKKKTTMPEVWRKHIDEGQKLVKENKFDEAEEHFSQAMKVAPDVPLVLVAVAKYRTALGDYQTALNYCQQAIKIDSLCEPAHLLLAMIFQRETKIDLAISEYERTIFINFENVVAHLQLANIYRSLNKTPNALKEYRSALTALARYRPDAMIEDLPVELLRRTCEDNIKRLSAKK
jgi:chemotaxis protein methyltransferase CheR